MLLESKLVCPSTVKDGLPGFAAIARAKVDSRNQGTGQEAISVFPV